LRIRDILDSTSSQKITIITPNKIEQKLLLDRFRFYNVTFSKKNVIKYKEIFINVITVDEVFSHWETLVDSFCFVEFPEAIPENVLNKLQLERNIIFTNELI
jgi:hypothetical protein